MKQSIIIALLTLVVVAGSAQTSTENWVKEITSRDAFTTEISGKTNEADVARNVTYLDGLGRVMQQVSSKASPNALDLVSVQTYDAYGRQTRSYLPYEQPAGDMSYRSGLELGDQQLLRDVVQRRRGREQFLLCRDGI